MDEKLKEDFPIDWDEDNYVSRREFFKFMTLASGGLALGSLGLAAWSAVPRRQRVFERVFVANATDVAIGAAMPFSYPRPTDLCLLIHPSQDEFVAYSRRCTHLSCPVEYQPDKNRIYCPCHNGAFSVKDGKVLQGPPPRPLPRIQLEIVGGQVFAVGVESEEA